MASKNLMFGNFPVNRSLNLINPRTNLLGKEKSHFRLILGKFVQIASGRPFVNKISG